MVDHCKGAYVLVVIVFGCLNELFKPRFGAQKLRRDELCCAAWPRYWNLDHFLHLTGMSGQHENAIGQENCLFEIVRDEDNGDVDLAPNFQQMRLHPASCLRVE